MTPLRKKVDSESRGILSSEMLYNFQRPSKRLYKVLETPKGLAQFIWVLEVKIILKFANTEFSNYHMND